MGERDPSPVEQESPLGRRYPLLGGNVQALTLVALNRIVSESIAGGRKTIIANHNLHSLYLLQKNQRMRRFFELADYTQIDGMSVIAIGRLLGLPLSGEHRVTYADWFPILLSFAAEHAWRVFYLGGTKESGERGTAMVAQRFPGLRFIARDGYFDARPEAEVNAQVLATIREASPHLLFVGMSMPRQEHWILDNLNDITANVILPCGAALDYYAGTVPTPPRWVGRIGLEWAFRLAAEPRRLAFRYLVEPWALLPSLVRELRTRRRSGGR